MGGVPLSIFVAVYLEVLSSEVFWGSLWPV